MKAEASRLRSAFSVSQSFHQSFSSFSCSTGFFLSLFLSQESIMGDSGVQKMFECYLYDYLVKNNMGKTAEIFRRETNLNFDPTRLPIVDAPDGFLHEWWVIFYDMFYSRKVVNEERDEGSSDVSEEMMKSGKQGEASTLRQHAMNGKLSGDVASSGNPGDTIQPLSTGSYLRN